MAFATINNTVALVVLDAQLKSLDDFVAQVKSSPDIDLETVLADFKTSLTESSKLAIKALYKGKGKGKNASGDEKIKSKRPPSVYNMYVGMKMQQYNAKKEGTSETAGVDNKNVFKEVSKAYNTDPEALFIKSKVNSLKKKDPDATIEDLFAAAKTAWDSGERDDAVQSEA